MGQGVAQTFPQGLVLGDTAGSLVDRLPKVASHSAAQLGVAPLPMANMPEKSRLWLGERTPPPVSCHSSQRAHVCMYLASRCQAQPHWAPQQARPPGCGSPGSGSLKSGQAVGSVSTRARPGVWREAALPTGRVTRYLRVSLSSLPTPAHTRVLVPRGHVGIGRNRGREGKKWLRINGATQRGPCGARGYSADGVRSGREQEPRFSIEKGRRQ